ncbi:single-stranded DNA-binding protein [Candidatus Cyanaurora vandensis]|uniref:single-stranded DNA-binding protein n=1 Tax=Candidatus Cyanaurora vandensis TaxID=2714958 RepID=UPI002579D031|nr:single-stranded DNA-binding protein [Candidatus Cyanaurora vandensis]
MGVNLVNLVGRAGRDPEMRFVGSGENYRAVCNLTLAVNRQRRKSEMSEPDWFNLEIWGKTAEVAGNYVKKGSLIGVSGSLVFSRWQDKTSGDNRERPLIRVDTLDLLGSKRDEGGGDAPDFSGEGEF